MIGKTVSHYHILEKLGEGGMGVVYKAEDTKLKRTVALKFLSPQVLGSEEEKTRFLYEAQAAAALNHPNICTIYEINEAEGQSFIAMEYIEGQSLKEKVESGTLTLEEAFNFAIQVVEALQEAHEKGIMHRDIKSANIMVIPTRRNQAKIMDFGLAKLTGRTQLTKIGTTLGTVAYMSPEQARGEGVDNRTDIWSLGVVLYEMLTGELPFKGDFEYAVVYSILNEDPKTISDLRADLPLEFEGIVNKCLEKEPSKRYQTVSELRADLLRVMSVMGWVPSATTSPMVPAPSPRLRLNRRLTVALAGVIMGLLLLLLIPTGWHAVEKWLGSEGVPNQKHLLVIPFTNIGDDPTNQAFCDGMVETLTSKVTQLEQFQGSLWVVPTSEVRKRGIASASEAQRAFGVNLVVTGSVQRIGDRFRLTLNLVDAKTLRQLSSSVIDDYMTNVSILQDGVVIKLTEMLDVEVQPQTRRVLTAGGTTVPGAYEFYLQGRGYLQRYEKVENLDTAISLFEQSIEQDTLYALAYTGLGEAYWRKYELTKNPKWVEKAQSSCNRAIQINEHLAPVHVTLGIIHNGTGRYEDALQEFQRASQIDPVNSDAYRGMARTYEALGKLVKAEATYKKAIGLRPTYWAGYNHLGGFYYRQGRYAEAEKMFRQVTELTPDNARGYYNRGAMYYLMGQYELAAALFEKSIAIKPTAQAYSNLGTTYFMLARYVDAVPMYKKAINLGENHYTIWGNLADSYRYTPEYSDKARETYQHAVQLAEKQLVINPNDARLRSSLAVYYANLGNHKKALDEIARAQQLAPEDVTVLFKRVLVFEFVKLHDQALEALKLALQRGYSIEEVRGHPDLSELRKDPRYQRLVMSDGAIGFDSKK
ncbi:MAG: protein kinase [bacterium]